MEWTAAAALPVAVITRQEGELKLGEVVLRTYALDTIEGAA
jgi:hypothetical protein